MMCAQDLESVVVPVKTPKKETTYNSISDRVASPISANEDTVNHNKVEEIESADDLLLNKVIPREENTYRKEEYLNKLLRQTYYQRITTNKWSKYLHPLGWKKNVEKWRYWTQLRNFVTSNQEVIVIRNSVTQPKDKALEHPVVDRPMDTMTYEEVAISIDTPIIEKVEIVTPLEPSEKILEQEKPSLTIVTEAPWLKEKSLPVLIDTSELALESTPNSDLESTNNIKEQNLNTLSDEKVANVNLTSEVTKTKTEEFSKANTKEKPITLTRTTQIASQEVIDVHPPTKTYAPPVTTIVTTNPSDFGQLKGILPWPVSSGRITDRFGIRKNAEARGLRPENYGIDMVCPSGTRVKAAHSGTVLIAKRQSPYDYIITIKHGDFTSAYYYLITPYVKPGDVVQSGQEIGQLRTSVAEADFHFEIWNNQDRVNPELWLGKR